MIGIFASFLYSLIGIGIVFLVLAVLILVIKIISARAIKPKEEAKESKPTPPPALAKGSFGSVARFDVPDKTAAMLMAIVADTTGKPLNTLRFISIREMKEEVQ